MGPERLNGRPGLQAGERQPVVYTEEVGEPDLSQGTDGARDPAAVS